MEHRPVRKLRKTRRPKRWLDAPGVESEIRGGPFLEMGSVVSILAKQETLLFEGPKGPAKRESFSVFVLAAKSAIMYQWKQ